MKTVEYTHHTPLTSSLVKKVWYASPKRELYVELNNGNVYGYKDVSPVAYENLLLSGSKGAFYNNSIKRQYSSTGSLYKSEMDFRPAPGLSRSRTDARTWGSSTIFGGPSATPAAKPKKNFQVTGTVLKPTTVREVIAAESLEDAIAQFRARYADKEPDVTGVASY